MPRIKSAKRYKIWGTRGFSKLFEDVEYGKSWETDKQLKYKKEWKEKEKKNGNAHEQTDTDKAE